MARLADYVTLSQARRIAGRVPEDVRSEAHLALARGAQLAGASASLWASGHLADALRLAGDAFTATLSATVAAAAATEAPEGARAADAVWQGAAGTEGAAEPPPEDPCGPTSAVGGSSGAVPEPTSAVEEPSGVAAGTASGADTPPEGACGPTPEVDASSEADDPPGWAALLVRRGAGPGLLEEVARLEARLSTRPLPALDAEVGGAHATLLRRLLRAERQVRLRVEPLAHSPGSLWTLQARRVFFLLLPLLVVAAGAAVAFAPPSRIHAHASATYQGRTTFEADRAVDGDPNTEWLLPDDTVGWLDLELDPPRRVGKVTIRNAANASYNDRGTKGYRVEVYARGRRVRSYTGEFETRGGRRPSRERVQWIGLARVEKIRVDVISWHGKGGGIAEVTFE